MDKIGFDSRCKETMPDGRVILELSALRMLSGVNPEVIDGRGLKVLIAEQKAAAEAAEASEEPVNEEEEKK